MEVAKDAIRETLEQAKVYLAQETAPKLSEADTKMYFLEPIIAALGWIGLGVVTREYFVKSSHEYIDYMMAVDGQPLLAVEAKPLQSPLVEKNAAQLVQYCAVEGVEWAVLTNGRELQFFNTFLKPDLNAKRVLDLELLAYSNDDEFDALVQQLSQLSRHSITTKAANSWLTQRRMDATLRAALLDPNSATIRALRKELSDAEIKATGSEIVHWARTHLASKPTVTKKVITPPPPVVTTKPTETPVIGNVFNPLDSYIFQGPHHALLPTFEALRSVVATIAPEATWRVMKHYIAAAHDGSTFLSMKRRASSIVLGVTVPQPASFALPQEDPSIFKWSRITAAFPISSVEEVNDEVKAVLALAMEHAKSGTGSHKQYYGITLKHLVDAGLLGIGEHLILMKGDTKVLDATLNSAAAIEANGTSYHSLSDRVFAEAMGRQSLNGWTHWFAKRNSSLVSLATLREQLIDHPTAL